MNSENSFQNEKGENRGRDLFEIGEKVKNALDIGDKETAKKYFGDFFQQSEPIIKGWLQRLDQKHGGGKDTRFASLIEDSMQTSYAKLWENFNTYFSNIGTENSLMGWLFVVTRNAYISQIRRQKKIENIEQQQERAELSLENDILDQNPEPSEELALDEILFLIDNIVNNIEESKTKEIAKMLYIDHLPEEDVMAKLDIDDHVFRSWHARIRDIICKNLESTGFEKIDEMLLEKLEKRKLRDINAEHKKALRKAEEDKNKAIEDLKKEIDQLKG